MQRFLNLREISFKHEGMSLSAYFEARQFPLCFFAKEIPIQLAVEKFVSLCRSLHVVEDCLLDSLEANLLKQGTQEEFDNEDRLCVATVICQDEQSLKVGKFVKGSYGWVVSTSDRLQCYAYTPCTLLFMVPARCRVNEACAPTSHLHLKHIFPLNKHQEEDCTMKNHDPGKVELSQATPLGFNPTKSPADSPGTPVGETSNKSDDAKDDSTKIVSPTQVWSEGIPVTREKTKTTPSFRRACDKVNVSTTQRNGTKIIVDQVDTSQSKPIPHSSPLLQQSEREGMNKPLPSQDRNKGEDPIASPSISPALGKVSNADQPAAGFVAGIEEDGSNVRPPIDSIVGCAEGDRCMLEKNALLHGEGVPGISGSIEKTSIPSHQSILPPKSQAALVKPVLPHQRSTSEKKKCSNRRASSATLARSVSPTIGKTLSNASQPKLQVCLQAQVRSKKRLSGKGRLHQRLDIDVSQPVGVPVPPDQEKSPREPIQSLVGQNIVDLEALISTEETKRDIGMKEQISDSVGKWCGSLNFSINNELHTLHLNF